jgi:hypothetical protein
MARKAHRTRKNRRGSGRKKIKMTRGRKATLKKRCKKYRKRVKKTNLGVVKRDQQLVGVNLVVNTHQVINVVSVVVLVKTVSYK